jgi:hypothetical protein
MKYMLMIYENEAVYEADGAMDDIVARHVAFSQQLGDRIVGGAGLKPVATATTVQTQSGAKTLHDGPFAETKEQFGGFYLVDVPDLDAAIEIARQVPLSADGSVEVRPLIEMDGAA